MPNTVLEAREALAAALRRRCIPCDFAADGHGVISDTPTYHFELHFMPGNRRTLISHAVRINPSERGKGEGTRLCLVREDAAKDAGVTLMLATVRNDNLAQIAVMRKCSWERFTNNLKTGCSLWGKIV